MPAPSAIGGALALTLTAAAAHAAPAAAPPAAAPTPSGETRFERRGFAVGVALGPAVFYGGRALSDVGGVGSALALRFETVATPELLWVFELGVGSYLVRVGDDTELPTHSVATLGGQLYLRDALWFGAGLGVASFARQSVEGVPIAETRQGGLAATGSVGVDVLRRGPVAVDLRASLHLARYDGAALAHGGLALGATWY